MVFIHRQMQLAPSAPRGRRMLFLMPFVFAVHFQTRAIDNDKTAWLRRLRQQLR